MEGRQRQKSSALASVNKDQCFAKSMSFDVQDLKFTNLNQQRNNPVFESVTRSKTGLPINSLTMSYFHTGIRTIIGAEAFHCPVRDGKEWDHLAMVIRLNWLPAQLIGSYAGQFMEYRNQLL